MDANEIRKANYDALYRDFCEKEAREGLPPRGSLNRFGDFTGINPRYLSHIKGGRKQIGADIARQLEQAFGKPHGWLDRDHVGGVDSNTRAEREFLALALRLFRVSPLEAQSVLVNFAAERLGGAAQAGGAGRDAA